MFYTYHQNNSGGYFIQNEDVDVFVVIEGASHNDIQRKANRIFKDYSEYCTCCGERWSSDISWDDLDDKPMVYDESVYDYKNKFHRGDKIIIHYENGNKETIIIDEQQLKKEEDEERLNRGKDRLALDVRDKDIYFLHGEEEFLKPENISFNFERDMADAKNIRGNTTISFVKDEYIVFNKENIISNRINIKKGSKYIYEKCVQFKTLADMLPSAISMLDEDVIAFCGDNYINCFAFNDSYGETNIRITFER